MKESPDSSKSAANSSECPDSGPAAATPDPAPASPPPTPDYDDRGVPSLDHVRDKIETRYAASLGAAELAEETAAARGVEEQEAERERAGKAKLEEIRRSMGR